GWRVWSRSLFETFSPAEGPNYSVPHLVAPGVNVYTCQRSGGHRHAHGTSPAAAVVSGVAALLLESDPFLSVDDLRDQLLVSCRALPGPPERQGAGLVQVG